MIERWVAAAALGLSVLFAPTVLAQPTPPRPPTTLSVVSFDGGWNLPVWAAQRQGFFEANGVVVQLSYTPNSAALLTGMFDGRYHIARASIDNFIAAHEGQSEAKIPESPDLFAFMADLRSRYGTPRKSLTDPSKYVDTSYLRKALD